MISKKPLCVVLVIDDPEYGGAQRQVIELTNNMDPTVLVKRQWDQHDIRSNVIFCRYLDAQSSNWHF